MSQQTGSRKQPEKASRPTEMPADKARVALGDLLDRAGFLGERFVICRHGKRIAALVSIEDLEKLEAVA